MGEWKEERKAQDHLELKECVNWAINYVHVITTLAQVRKYTLVWQHVYAVHMLVLSAHKATH